MRKVFVTMLGLALAGSATPVLAQQGAPGAAPAAGWTAGAKVSDTAGGEVGTIAKVEGEFVVLKTDKHEVRLPKTSFTAHSGGFVMAMTRAQVNAAVEQTLAQADQKIKVGAPVTGSQGGGIGTIEALDADSVTLKLTSGKLVKVPRNSVAPGAEGAAIGMTVAELEAAAGQAAAEPAAQAEKDAPAGTPDDEG